MVKKPFPLGKESHSRDYCQSFHPISHCMHTCLFVSEQQILSTLMWSFANLLYSETVLSTQSMLVSVITKHVDYNVFLCDLQVPLLGLVHHGRVLTLPGVEQDVVAWSTAYSIADLLLLWPAVTWHALLFSASWLAVACVVLVKCSRLDIHQQPEQSCFNNQDL
jgi:hypothetical protein